MIFSCIFCQIGDLKETLNKEREIVEEKERQVRGTVGDCIYKDFMAYFFISGKTLE